VPTINGWQCNYFHSCGPTCHGSPYLFIWPDYAPLSEIAYSGILTPHGTRQSDGHPLILTLRKGKPTNKQVGRNLLAQIREEGINQKTPIIIVTGHNNHDPIVVCDFMRDGADYFLPKTMIDHLEAKIRKVFSKPLPKNGKAAPSEKAFPTLKPFPGGKLEF
jgi:hypothetical protein